MQRRTLLQIAAAPLVPSTFASQLPDDPLPPSPHLGNRPEDTKLPNGKSQKDAIAHENHQKALDETEELVRLATALQEELKKAGEFVVPVASLKRTEDIEKLARRIRARLKA